MVTVTDNVVVNAMPVIAKTLKDEKIPSLAFDEGSVENGALIAEGVNYRKIGTRAGQMAGEILKENKNIKDIPFEDAKDLEMLVNKETAEILGLDLNKEALKKQILWKIRKENKMTVLINIMASSVEIGLVFGVLAMGYMLTYKILEYYDLTLEGSYPLGAFLTAAAITSGLNPYFGLVLSVIGGAAAGSITYFLYKKVKVEPLLTGILTLTVLYSVNLKIKGVSNIPVAQYPSIFGSIPKWIILLAFVLVIKFLIDHFLRSEQGYLLKVTGNNRKLVKALGKDPDTYVFWGLIISNALIGLAGGMMTNYQGFADIGMGTAMIVTGLASIIIGDTIAKNSNKLRDTTRAILGAIVYRLISGIAIYFGLNPNDLKLITALIVIAFIAYNNYLGKKQYRKLVKDVRN